MSAAAPVMRRGHTLLELIVALAVGGVVGGAVGSLLVAQQRLYAAVQATVAGRQQVAQALGVIVWDLRALSPRDGDVTALARDSMRFRATIGAAIACAAVPGASLDLPPIHDPAAPGLVGWSSTPRAGDTLLVHDAGDDTLAATERWTSHAVLALDAGAGSCPAGAVSAGGAGPGYRVRVDPATPLPATVGAGTAVRFLRHVRYRLYRASDDRWYLGYADYRAGTGWATTQPVGGPYAPPRDDAPFFRFRDAAGGEVGDPQRADLARVTIVARALPAWRGGPRLVAPAVDSVDVALRNAHE